MFGYARHLLASRAPQTAKARRNQVKNSAGGYVFALDVWARLDRFLVLGSEGGTYYASERALTQDNARAVLDALHADPARAVAQITAISVAGRAPKNDAAIFALALAMSLGDARAKEHAFAALPKICRTGTHLFQLVRDVRTLRSWGRGLRRAIAGWYNALPASTLAVQVAKYGQRAGYSHRDLLRLSHPKAASPAHAAVYRWLTQGEKGAELPTLLHGFEAVRAAKTAAEVTALVREHRLTHEMVPSDFKNDRSVWEALLEEMPLTALVRNLGKLSSMGLLEPLARTTKNVADKLRNRKLLRKARIHPISLLSALRVYSQGHGERGKLTWKPVEAIKAALDDAFYAAFEHVDPTNVRHLIALDVSGSMTGGLIAGIPGMNPRVASAAMAMVTARSAREHHLLGFSDTLVPLAISPRSRLEETIRTIERVPMGATDCALPMLHAAKAKIPVDTFVVYTDNETWFGAVHPYRALLDYRQAMGLPAKLVVVGLTATKFSIADPDDAGMLDVVGFDSAAPQLLAQFAAA